MPIVLSSGDEGDEEDNNKIKPKPKPKIEKQEEDDEDSSTEDSEELETGLVRKRIAMQDTVYAYKPWTEDDKLKLVEMKNKGTTWERLSQEFNLQQRSLQLRYDEVLCPETFEGQSWSVDDQVRLIEWCTKSFKMQHSINFPTLSKKLNKDMDDCKTKWKSLTIPLGKKRKRDLDDTGGKPRKRTNIYQERSNVYKARTLSESEGDYSDGSSESEAEGGIKAVIEQSNMKVTPQKKLKRRKRQRLIRHKGDKGRTKKGTKKDKETRELEELWEVADRLQPKRDRRRARKQGFWNEKMEEFEDYFGEQQEFTVDGEESDYGY